MKTKTLLLVGVLFGLTQIPWPQIPFQRVHALTSAQTLPLTCATPMDVSTLVLSLTT